MCKSLPRGKYSYGFLEYLRLGELSIRPFNHCFYMVRGNWERRAELAALRKIANREKKLHRDELKAVNPESIIAKLCHHQENSPVKLNISCWALDINPERDERFTDEDNSFNSMDSFQCRAWFRQGVCMNRRCKYSHQETLAPALNIPYSEEDPPSEPVMKMKSLSEMKKRKGLHLGLILIDNFCVYDYQHESIWTSYLVSAHSIFEVAQHRRIRSISEDEDDVEEVCLEEENNSGPMAFVSGTSSPGSSIAVSSFMAYLHRGVLNHVYPFLLALEIASLLQCCKFIRQEVLRDSHCRRAIKEAVSAFSASASKKRKEEKRKRVKNSFVKVSDKKDEFARGGPAR